MTGILPIDKPAGLSSARAVAAVKRLLPREPRIKVGHAGTLDPFATGLLLILIGRKTTKLCESLMDQPKQYDVTFKLGATTPTDDPESPEVSSIHSDPIAVERIDRLLPSFTGAIQQRPPAYSALKLGGRRAYQLARQGIAADLKPRTVRVYGIRRLAYDWPLLSLRIDCGRGTYIRAIARDLGEAMGCGAYCTALRRTRIGFFDIQSAIPLSDLTARNLPDKLVQDIPHFPLPPE